jgi:hypothetical protein
MKTYTFEQYKIEFEYLLGQFIKCDPAHNYPNLIFGSTSNRLANDMADLEEEYPDFAKIYENQYNY